MLTLGRAIQIARLEQGLPQKALVDKTGLSQKYLSQIEHDRVNPKFAIVQRIARALGVSLDPLTLALLPQFTSDASSDGCNSE